MHVHVEHLRQIMGMGTTGELRKGASRGSFDGCLVRHQGARLKGSSIGVRPSAAARRTFSGGPPRGCGGCSAAPLSLIVSSFAKMRPWMASRSAAGRIGSKPPSSVCRRHQGVT